MDRDRRIKDGLYRTRLTLENGYVESFNARLRDELLNGEIFYSLREAQIIIESCGVITMLSGRTLRSATSHQRPRSSCRRWLHGLTRRLRPLPRPRSI